MSHSVFFKLFLMRNLTCYAILSVGWSYWFCLSNAQLINQSYNYFISIFSGNLGFSQKVEWKNSIFLTSRLSKATKIICFLLTKFCRREGVCCYSKFQKKMIFLWKSMKKSLWCESASPVEANHLSESNSSVEVNQLLYHKLLKIIGNNCNYHHISRY